MRISIGLVGVLGLGVSATIALAQPQSQPVAPKRGAVLLPPQRYEAGDAPVARAASEELAGSTPVTRSGGPAWLGGTDPGVRPAGGLAGGTAGNTGNAVNRLPPQPQPQPNIAPTQSEPSFVARSIDKIKGTFATEKTERPLPPGVGGQPGATDPRNPANANNANNAGTAFRGTAANGAPVYAGPPAYRWYGWGSVTPGANPYAPNGNYPRASANWHSITGATPGAFPVPVMNPMRPTPGTEPPVYAHTPAPRTSAPVYTSTLGPTSGGSSGPEFPPLTSPGSTRPPAMPISTPISTPVITQPATPAFVPAAIEAPKPLTPLPTATLPAPLPAPLPTLPVNATVTPTQSFPVSVPTITPPPLSVPTITPLPVSVVPLPAMGVGEPVTTKPPEATGPRVSDAGTFSGIPLPKLPELPPVPPVSVAPPAVPAVPAAVPAVPPARTPLTVTKPVEEQPKWETGTSRPTGEEWNGAPKQPAFQPVVPSVGPQSRGTEERQPVARGQAADNRPDPIVTLITKMCENRADGVDVRWVGSKKITVCFESRSAADAQRLVRDISARQELAPYHVDFCVLVK